MSSNDRPFPSAEAIEDAAARLDAGELVAFPTETVYGLGADAQNPAAVARIYAAKGRPANHPVIVHLAPGSDPGYWVEALPADAKKLIDAFWPGPLTLILKRATHIPDAVSGGQDSVGLRCPSHPVAQALLRAFDARRGGHGRLAAGERDARAERRDAAEHAAAIGVLGKVGRRGMLVSHFCSSIFWLVGRSAARRRPNR